MGLIASSLSATAAGAASVAAASPADVPPIATPTSNPTPSSFNIDAPPSPDFIRRAPQPRGELPLKRIVWKRCPDVRQLQCGHMRVPKFWNKRQKGTKNTIVLSLRRLPTTAKAKRPTLFTNPGGPGASGTEFLTNTFPAFTPLRSHYNIVAWDPRGVPTSKPLPRNCAPLSIEAKPTVGPFTWRQAGNWRYRATAKQVGSCFKANSSTKKWVSTNSVVRDLDAMRHAVGDKKLSYLGFSYGTRIGQTYLLTYPNRVRVMVQDGVMSPAATQDQLAQLQLRGATRGWRMLWRGLSPGIRSVYLKTQAYLQNNTIGSGATRTTRWTFWTLAINSARAKQTVADLPKNICVLGAAAGISSSACDPYTSSTVQQRNQTLRSIKRIATVPLASPLLQLVNCTDSRKLISRKAAENWSIRTAKYGGSEPAANQFAWTYVCAGLKKSSDPIPGLTKRTKIPQPPLIVNGVGDVATPYGGAVQAHKLLPKSRLITVDTTVHALSLLQGSRCVDKVILQYLKTTKLPKRNVKCPALPKT